MAASLLDIGAYLRQAREAKGLTIEAAAQAVMIRSQYIRGIEEGDVSLLPPPVYVRGFIEKYANLLGLDGRRLAAEYQPLRQTASPKPLSGPPLFQPRPFHLWALYVVLIMSVVGGLSTLVERRTNLPDQALLQQALRTQTEAPSAAPEPLGLTFQTLNDWTYIAGVFPERDIRVAALNRPAANPDVVALMVRVVETASWLRVTVDSETVFEGILQPGTQETWEGEESIVVLAGNAGGVLITLNGEEMGVLGAFGEVREQEFRRIQ